MVSRVTKQPNKRENIMNKLITREFAANLNDDDFNAMYNEFLTKKTDILDEAVNIKAKKNEFVFEQFNELYEAKELKKTIKFNARISEIGEAAYYE